MKSSLLAILLFLAGCQQTIDSSVTSETGLSEPQETQVKPKSKPGLASVFRQLAVVQDKKLNEISGMVPSSNGQGVWVLNDSGGEDELYLVDRGGKLKQTVELKGAKQRDWEDLAKFRVGDNNYLLIADSGNNQLQARPAKLFVVPEPTQSNTSISIDVMLEIEVAFPDHAYDCESVAVAGQYIVLATKASPLQPSQRRVSELFVVPLPEIKKRKGAVSLQAKRLAVGPLPFTTAMDVSEDGKHLLIRDYLVMALYQRSENEDWAEVLKRPPVVKFPGPFQKQAEAACFSNDGKQIWTISEGTHPTWWSADLAKSTE